MARTHKLAAGCYGTTEGHRILRAEDEAGRCYGWHLIGPDGQWWQTYATKADAIDALEA